MPIALLEKHCLTARPALSKRDGSETHWDGRSKRRLMPALLDPHGCVRPGHALSLERLGRRNSRFAISTSSPPMRRAPRALCWPLHARIAASVAELRARALAIVERLGWATECVRASEATIGGGSLPGEVLASVAIAVPTRRPERAARALRIAGVIGRVQDDALLLDLRAVAPAEDEALVAVLRGLALE